MLEKLQANVNLVYLVEFFKQNKPVGRVFIENYRDLNKYADMIVSGAKVDAKITALPRLSAINCIDHVRRNVDNLFRGGGVIDA